MLSMKAMCWLRPAAVSRLRFALYASALVAAPLLDAQIRLSGRITNDTDAPIAGAAVVATQRADSSQNPVAFDTTSDATGEFTLTFPAPGPFSLRVEREGFYVHTAPLDVTAESMPELHVALRTIDELQTRLDVTDRVGVIDMDRTTPRTSVGSRLLYDIPFPNQNSLRSSLRIMPGLILDSAGQIHLFGGSERQAEYTFEGFQINAPLTGQFDARMSLESVESVEIAPSESDAGIGRGSAGAMSLRARTGGNDFLFNGTNVFPSLSSGKGREVSSWDPRGYLSGPWIKDKAWFFNTAEVQFANTIVPAPVSGQYSARSWLLSDSLHNQINLGARDILRIGGLYNYRSSPHSGLTTLDPLSTTLNLRSAEGLGYVKEQHFFSHSSLIEFGFSGSRSFTRLAPQGSEAYTITPDGRTGDNYLNVGREARRYQGLVNGYFPPFRFLGSHQLKMGADIIHLDYGQDAIRSAINYAGLGGGIARVVGFSGSGVVGTDNTQSAFYVQDSWRLLQRLIVDLGWRVDRDRLLGRTNGAPRFGFGWSPFGADRIRLSGGFSRIFDSADLSLFVRPLDQTTTSVYYDPQGALLYGPLTSVFRFGTNVQSPRADIWNIAAERNVAWQMHAKLQLVRRRYTDGFNYTSTLPVGEQLPAILGGAPNPGPLTQNFVLDNSREDKYDSAELSVRQPIRGRFEWMVSYTRSRAWSNAVLDRGVDQPLSVATNFGALPWDAPNRLVSWGFLPALRKNWAVAYLLDWHTGFPFSVVDQYGRLVGQADDHRFNPFFELDLFVERQTVVRGYVVAVRAGFNNITGHQNSNLVDNVIGGTTFLRQYGGQARAFNVRLRFLGKQ